MASKPNQSEQEAQLRTEGYTHIFEWSDPPNAHYPPHVHSTETTHLILEGELTLAMNGQTRTFVAGDRADVGAQELHEAWMGPNGCRYLVGEK
ncbi:uncharacterized protein VTP21DRAFT_9525 [Calcarisporiella thermophila]|uniref:uncharacterized protein n=1 Tax=Calcarisporiella thermophila TaxID=911321 RepID=UPI00374323CF